MKKCILLLLIILCISVNGFAQKTISGVVSDGSGEPIIGATVVVKNTTRGAVTNLNGEYSLVIPENADTLVFSFIGKLTEEINVENQTKINITLLDDILNLEDVVVVAYGFQKKESVVGAISQVKSEELVSSGVPNIANAITGKLSGVVTLETSGQPGETDATNIFIRGRSTWNSADPLVMVDGIERTLTDIDPNDVESISVLKDASATAVYGTKGANGVILITTKRGRTGKAEISASVTQTFKQPTSIPKYYDAYSTLSIANEAKKNDNNWGGLTSQEELEYYRSQDLPYQYPSVNFYDALLKDYGLSTNASVNLSGGTDFVKYFTSVGFLHEGDILDTEKDGFYDPRHYYDRYTVRSNLDFNLTQTTTLSTNISGSLQMQNQPIMFQQIFWGNMMAGDVTNGPVYYPAELLEQFPDPLDPDANEDRLVHRDDNPYTLLYGGEVKEQLNGGFQKRSTNKLDNDIILDQKLDFILEGLSVSGKISFSTQTIYLKKYSRELAGYKLNPDSSWTRFPDYDTQTDPFRLTEDDLVSNGSTYFRKLYYEMRMNYDRTFGSHYVTAMGLFYRRKNDIRNIEPFKTEAWSGRATYSYALKYLFEFNIGYTGSEQFAPANRFGLFPAFAVGWNIAEENFVKNNLPFLNKLKLRYSYGKTGNDNASARWLYYSTWEEFPARGNFAYTNYPVWGTADAVFGGSPSTEWEADHGYDEGKAANKTAQWEEAVKNNFGIEVRLFNNTFNFSIDWFKEERDNILMEPSTIPTWVRVDFKPLNIGQTKNHGYEIEASYQNRTGFGLGYGISGNMSWNENRVIFRDDAPYLPDYQKASGFPIGVGKGPWFDDYYRSLDEAVNLLHYRETPNAIEGDARFVDYNADGVIDGLDDVPYPELTIPQYNYGITINFDYKGFALNVLVQGMKGKSSIFRNITDSK